MKAVEKIKGSRLALAAVLCVGLTACASTQGKNADGSYDDDYGYGYNGEIADPLEDVNRATFAMNEFVDDVLLEPVARGYRNFTPPPVRTGVRNFLQNLRSPINIANQILQGDLKGAGNDIARVVLNTTFGAAGLVDVATAVGFEYEKEDFGQTLASWGFDHGAYLVLPIAGPSSVRDGIGLLVDSYADPLRLYLFNTHEEEWYYARVAATAVDQREALLDVLEDLQKNSFDYYAALRSVYTQKREDEVRDSKSEGTVVAAIPDYDNETYYE